MPTEKDLQIFCCGVVQYAMSSGKFEADDILKLAERAHDAFVAVLGKPDSAPAPQQPHSPQPGHSAMPTPSMPESLDFNIWKGDKCGHWDGSVRDVAWEFLLEKAKAKDEKALKAINDMAVNDPGDPAARWYKSNVKRVSRAKTLLLML